MTRRRDRFASGESPARKREERAQDTKARIAAALKELSSEHYKSKQVADLEEAEEIVQQQRDQLPVKPGGIQAAYTQTEGSEKADTRLGTARRGYNGRGRPPWA